MKKKDEEPAEEPTSLYHLVEYSRIFDPDGLELAKMKTPNGAVLYCAYAEKAGKLSFGVTQEEALFSLQRMLEEAG